MKRIQRLLTVPCLAALLLSAYGYGMESLAPRFPDTELPAPEPESDLMSRQGQVYVTGTLLVSPCTLSDWASEVQGHSWFSGQVKQVTLVLEGCGDGTVHDSLRANPPLFVRGVWGGEQFSFRLDDGMNYLSLPVPSGRNGMRLEMTYE
ncbi:hypothetical protein DS275_20750 [Salmonella enterica subsp. salamae serovar Sofia]|nr:hypothetical protein [Salmonella enterica subsp. salamae serovar Sofia]